jgi:hypothetical protein
MIDTGGETWGEVLPEIVFSWEALGVDSLDATCIRAHQQTLKSQSYGSQVPEGNYGRKDQ